MTAVHFVWDAGTGMRVVRCCTCERPEECLVESPHPCLPRLGSFAPGIACCGGYVIGKPVSGLYIAFPGCEGGEMRRMDEAFELVRGLGTGLGALFSSGLQASPRN